MRSAISSCLCSLGWSCSLRLTQRPSKARGGFRDSGSRGSAGATGGSCVEPERVRRRCDREPLLEAGVRRLQEDPGAEGRRGREVPRGRAAQDTHHDQQLKFGAPGESWVLVFFCEVEVMGRDTSCLSPEGKRGRRRSHAVLEATGLSTARRCRSSRARISRRTGRSRGPQCGH